MLFSSGDKDALVAFALMSTQYRGGSPTDLLNTILPFIIEESNDIEHDTKMMLLAAGGLSPGMLSTPYALHYIRIAFHLKPYSCLCRKVTAHA